jgi:hypothetical protein
MMTKDFLYNLGKVAFVNSMGRKGISKRNNKLRKGEFMCELKIPNPLKFIKNE